MRLWLLLLWREKRRETDALQKGAKVKAYNNRVVKNIFLKKIIKLLNMVMVYSIRRVIINIIIFNMEENS